MRREEVRRLAAEALAKYKVINGRPKSVTVSEDLHGALCFLATLKGIDAEDYDRGTR